MGLHEKIFINYRVSDTLDLAEELFEALGAEFGRENVFFDKRRLTVRDFWDMQILDALSEATTVLCLIGDGWLTPMDGTTLPRLFERRDVVRREIALALHRRPTNVIPVLCGNVGLKPGSIPLSIRQLLRLQGVRLRRDNFLRDKEELVRSMTKFRTTHVGLRKAGPEERPDENRRAFARLVNEINSVRPASRLWAAIKNLPSGKPKPSKGDGTLIEDPDLVARMYREPIIHPGIPYVEVVGWSRELAEGFTPRIEVEPLDGDFNLSPWKYAEFNKARIDALDEYKATHKKTYPGPAVRIESYAPAPATLRLETRFANFWDQVQSNRTIDRPLNVNGKKSSARIELLHEFKRKLPPIEDGRMANTLGVAALIFWKSPNGWVPYFTLRGKDVSFMNGFHCTASGVAEYGKPWERKTFHIDSIYRELNEEVGLERGDLTSLMPVAFCRELVRGGKPQMFFIGTTELPLREIEKKLLEARRRGLDPEKRTEGSGPPRQETIGPAIVKWLSGVGASETIAAFRTAGMTTECAALVYYFDEVQRQRPLLSKVQARLRRVFG